MSATTTQPREQILELIRGVTLSEEAFDAFNSVIDKKLAAKMPEAKEDELQPGLERYYGVYLEAVRKHKGNLQKQFDLGKKLARDIEMMEEMGGIASRLTRFQADMALMLEEHSKLHEEITVLEGVITSMMPADAELIR